MPRRAGEFRTATQYHVNLMTHAANDRKVLVIGWDAADWRVIEPLIADGKMPNLKAFMETGVHGNISTLNPVLSPMLWTSIATGKRPYKHGIHGFSEPTPDGKGVRPITNISRKTKAVWNILNQNDKRSIVVGWWPSHPAEPLDGVMVSNHYQRAGKLKDVDIDAEIGRPRPEKFGWELDQWPMQPGTVHPKELARNLQEFRFHPLELDAEHIGPFIPNFGKIDQKKDKRLVGFAKTLSDCVSIHGAATALMQLEPWDLMCVYYDGIDHFGHGFMKYHPPRQEWISEKDFEIYSGVVEGGYRFHDMMLGSMMTLAGDDTTVILLSDHGFHPDHLRPQHIPVEPAGPAIEHRPYGIFVMKGPDIRQGERVHGVSVLDLCPTVLQVFGLPVARDMDGKPVVTAFKETPKIGVIDSWDAVEGESGMHPPDALLDSVESAEAMKQLVELGYIEEPNEDQDVAVRETVRELKYNVAQAYMDGGLHNEAIPLLEEIWEEWPSEHRFGLNLLGCYGAVGNYDVRLAGMRTLAENVIEHRRKALDQIEELREEAEKYDMKLPRIETDESGNKRIVGWGAESDNGKEEGKESEDEDGGEETKEFEEPPRKLQFKVRKVLSLLQPFDGVFTWLEATQALATGNDDRAIPFLEQAAKIESKSPEPHNQVGMGFLQVEHWMDARDAFNRALDTDSENSTAHLGLAVASKGLGEWDTAIDHSLTATELIYFNPRAHLTLAGALRSSGDHEMARTAYEVAIKQAPGFAEALEELADLLEQDFQDPKSASNYRDAAKLAREAATEQRKVTEIDIDTLQAEINERRLDRPEAKGNSEDWSDVPSEEIVTIVSGLPRSGTSMMMQMLDRGGLDPFTDGKREADPDNPKGYYEHEKATQLGRDRSWIPDVRGKCVKIVAQLLPMLPKDQKYRIVFMDRDLREISRSQGAMLERLGREGGDLSEARLMSTLDAHVRGIEKWMAHRPHVQCLFVDYADVLEDPRGVALKLNEFFGGALDEDSMCSAVDPALQRQRVKD